MNETAEEAEKDKKRKLFQARKVENAMNPASIVIAPKTPEAEMFTQILMNFDRGLNQMHLRAGTYIPMQKVVEIQEEVASCFKALDIHMEGLNPLYSTMKQGVALHDPDSSLESKRRLAEANYSWVFMPKTMEGNQLARAIKMMDIQLVSLKTTCSDFTKIGTITNGTVDLIRGFYEVTEKLAKVTDVELKYRRKGRLEMVIGRGDKESTESTTQSAKQKKDKGAREAA